MESSLMRDMQTGHDRARRCETDMTKDLIGYDQLAQKALRNVIREVLSDIVEKGALPGEHHFYIAFDTHARGVQLSPRLRERYPDEMTIILQHQFWDLQVSDTAFEVKLSFNNVPERLEIPFEAIRGFFDPSVQFRLQFAAYDAAPLMVDLEQAEAAPEPVAKGAKPAKPAKPAKVDTAGPAEKAAAGRDGADVVRLDTFRKKS